MNKSIFVAILSGFISTQVSASNWQALPETAPAPADNPTTAAKVELGKMLFMDPRLSSTGTVSCNSCHNIMEGGDDSRAVSMGVKGQTGGRSAPTVWNAAFYSVQFWDGRANLLEDQAKGPITNPIEMGMKDHNQAMGVIKSIPGYKAPFEKAFGKGSMNIVNAAKAIAAFERTLITPNSAYDRFVKGDKKALNKQQQKGMNKFAGLGCVSCHSGAAFNGPENKIGVGFYAKFPTFADNAFVKKYKLTDDKGRAEVTGKKEDTNMFRVPTLRNISDTAPYFHNGAVATLDEAVRIMAKTQLNQDLSAQDTKDIVAFLGALSGEYPEITMPRLPASKGSTVIAD